MNTHKVDMSQLITDQKNTEDVKFIFAHIKGQAKEIDVTTPHDGLGLTIADNGVNYAFIKGIDKESILYKHNLISVGDHLEKIEGKSVVGRKHAEILNMLNDIPKGTTVTIRVVEPLKSGVCKYLIFKNVVQGHQTPFSCLLPQWFSVLLSLYQKHIMKPIVGLY